MTRSKSRHPASQKETKGADVTVSVGSCPAERDARLRVGFVGAGKIGFALGTHLVRTRFESLRLCKPHAKGGALGIAVHAFRFLFLAASAS